MVLEIVYSSRFKRDYKRMMKRGRKEEDLREVLEYLVNRKELPERYHDHALSGDYVGFNECHINPDWLLIYRVNQKELVLLLARTGTHSDLF